MSSIFPKKNQFKDRRDKKTLFRTGKISTVPEITVGDAKMGCGCESADIDV